MGVDGDVIIPIKLTIDASMVEQEASDGLNKLKPVLENLKQEISEVKDSAKRVEFNNAIKGATELANSMSLTISEANAARSEVSKLQQAFLEAQRTVKESADATEEQKEEVELLKQTWLAAKRGTSAYEEQLKELSEPIDEHIAKLNELSRKVLEVKIDEKYAGKRSFDWNKSSKDIDGATESLDIFEKKLEEVKRKSEEYGVGREKVAKFEQIYNETKVKSLTKVEELEKQIDEEIAGIVSNEEKEAELEKLREAELKAQTAEIRAQIRAEQETAKQAKLTTSQYYYRLRSMKMVNRYLQMLNGAMDNFGKKSLNVSANIVKNYIKVATGFGLLRKSIGLLLGSLGKIGGRLGTVSKAFAKTNKEVRRTTAAHKDFGKSITTNLKLFLRYALGIRSLFVLFNRLRSAMMDGLTALATQFDDVNSDMSSLKSSLVQMKNSLASMVQPIVSVLVPAFESLSESISNVSVKVASFFAAFTGQDYVYKAKRTQEQFVESVEDSNKAMEDSADASEEAKGQLQSYDKLLNVTTKDEKKKDDDKNDPLTNAFDVVPINKKVADIVDKIKDLLSRLFAPLKKAWDKEGKFVMDAWKYALGEIWKLIKDIGRDFMRVWEEPRTQEIFENILHVLGDIGLVIGHLARNFREAWNENENGYRILAAIRDIIWVISKGLREAADYTVEWADALSFKPLMNAIADVLEKQIVPAVQKIVDLLVYLYTKIFLEILRFLIEDLLPIIVHIFGNLVESIGNLAENIHKALAEGQLGERILKEIEDIVMIVAKGLLECSKYTVEWSKHLDFSPFFKEMLNLLTKVKGATQKIVDLFVYLYENILTKIVQDFLENGLPQIERIVGYIVETIGNIAGQLHKALEENDRGVQILEHTEILIGKIADAIEYCAKRTAEWAGELDFGPLLDAIDNFLVNSQPMIQFIADVLSKLWTDVLLPLWTYLIEEGLPKLLDTLGKISAMIDWESLKEKVDGFLESFEKFLEKAWETFVIILGDLGTAIANFVNSDTFGNFIDLLIKWMDNANPEEMAKGIEQLVVHFIAMKAALSFLTYLGALREFVMTLVNWHNNKAMTTTIAQTSANIAQLNKSMEGLPAKMAEAARSADEASTSIASVGTASKTSAALTTASSLAAVAAVALIAGAFVTLWTNDENFREKMKEGWNHIITVTKDASLKIKEALATIDINITSIKGAWISWCESISPVFDGVLKNIAIVIEGFGKIISGLLNFIIGAVGSIYSLINGDIQGAISGAEQAFTGFTSVMSGIYGTVVSEFKNSLGTLINVADKSGYIINESATRTEEDVASHSFGIQQSIDGVTTSYTNLGTQVSTIGNQTIIADEALAVNKTNVDNLATSVGTLDTDIGIATGNISTTVPTISTSINDAMVSSTTSVSTAKTDIHTNLGEMTDDFSNTPQNMYDGFEKGWTDSFGIDAANVIATIISPSFGAIIFAVRELLDSHSPSGVFEDIGFDVVDGFILGIEENWPSTIGLFAEVIPELIDYIFGFLDDFIGLGFDLIQGLLEGMQDAWSDVVDWILQVCADLIDDVKAFFGIASPSKVMISVGEFLSEGLAVGINNSADDAIDATKDVAKEIVQEASQIAEETLDDIELNFTLTESLTNLEKMVEQANILRDVFNSINVIATNINDSTLKIPDIASGKVLPTKVNVMTAQNDKDNSAINSDEMYNIINDAVYSAIKNAYNNGMLSDDRDVVMQVDGREMARAVKRENDIYRKSTGRSMFNV